MEIPTYVFSCEYSEIPANGFFCVLQIDYLGPVMTALKDRYLSLNPTYLAKGISSSVMCYAIWYHLYNFKNVKNIHGEVLLLVKLQAKAKARNFTKSNTLPWVFFMFSKLYKWYQIAQRITSLLTHLFDRTQHNRLRCSSPQTEHKCSPPTLALHL